MLRRAFAFIVCSNSNLHAGHTPHDSRFVQAKVFCRPVAGDNRIEKSYPQYTPPQAEQPGRVYLNKSQYFEGITPGVWGFYIGGYQVLVKWLKDRQGRQLAYDDLTHYQKIGVALQKTIELMEQIDQTIPQWPLSKSASENGSH